MPGRIAGVYISGRMAGLYGCGPISGRGLACSPPFLPAQSALAIIDLEMMTKKSMTAHTKLCSSYFWQDHRKYYLIIILSLARAS